MANFVGIGDESEVRLQEHSDMAKEALVFGALRRCWSASAKSGTRTLTTCRAVVLPRFGGPEVLEVRDDAVLPDLCDSDVLVRSRAVGVNPLDMRMREGYGRSLFEPLLPLVLGRDVSGEVTAVGSNVHKFHLGDQVFGALHPTATRGTYSEYAILGEEQLAPKPESLSHSVRSVSSFE